MEPSVEHFKFSATTIVLIWNAKVLKLQCSSVLSSMAISESFHFPLYATFSIGFWHGLDPGLRLPVSVACSWWARAGGSQNHN